MQRFISSDIMRELESWFWMASLTFLRVTVMVLAIAPEIPPAARLTKELTSALDIMTD